MRLPDNTIRFVCVILAISFIVTAGMQLDYINSKRQELKLIVNAPLENAPPSLAFATVAMGAFRGLLVDALWMRADRLKSEGQFFDAKQLAEWITVLQPRFSKVWEFQAWNMAYNISVAIPATSPDQRWHWVKNGYEILRDKGIPLNPKKILLYQELGRIFFHKIGGITDDAHKYYKLQLALSISPLLGDAGNEYYSELAKAPKTMDDVLADPNYVSFINGLKEADPGFYDNDKFISNYIALRDNPKKYDPNAAMFLDFAKDTREYNRFNIFANAYQLRKVWKLEPSLMVDLNKTYGPIDLVDPNVRLPLDWRLADVHAIYWAVQGLKVAGQENVSIEETNTDRLINQALQDLFRNGTLYIYEPKAIDKSDPNVNSPLVQANNVFLRPDLRMFESYNKAVMATIAKYREKEDMKHGSFQSFEMGHRNMMKNAVFSFYQAGHIAYARKFYNEMRILYPLDEFRVPLEVYAKKRFQEELKAIDVMSAGELINMMLREGYFRLAMYDDNEAANRESIAKEIYDYYGREFPEETRIALPDFNLLKFTAMIDFFNDRQYPDKMRNNLIERIRIEKPKLAEQMMEIQMRYLQQQEKLQE